MIQEHDVRAKLAALLHRDVSLEQFERWIVDESWNMHSDSRPSAIDLVSDIQILLAEHADQSLDDDALRRELSVLLENMVIEVSDVAAVVRRRTASRAFAWAGAVPQMNPVRHRPNSVAATGINATSELLQTA